jgi:hypothetical protein
MGEVRRGSVTTKSSIFLSLFFDPLVTFYLFVLYPRNTADEISECVQETLVGHKGIKSTTVSSPPISNHQPSKSTRPNSPARYKVAIDVKIYLANPSARSRFQVKQNNHSKSPALRPHI